MMLEKLRPFFKSRWRRTLVEILVFLVFYLAIRTWLQRDLPQGMAPNLQGVTLNGVTVDLQAMSRTKPVLLHFWATWCPVCKLEQASIQALSQQYTILTIATQSGNADTVRQFMRTQGLDFPVLSDEDGSLMQRYGLHGVPASFFINRRGEIAFQEIGYTTQWGMQARLWLLQ